MNTNFTHWFTTSFLQTQLVTPDFSEIHQLTGFKWNFVSTQDRQLRVYQAKLLLCCSQSLRQYKAPIIQIRAEQTFPPMAGCTRSFTCVLQHPVLSAALLLVLKLSRNIVRMLTKSDLLGKISVDRCTEVRSFLSMA